MNPHDIHSEKYRDRWVQAVESTRKHLIFQTEPYDLENGFEPLYFLHGYSVQGLRNEMGHLDCFAGGNMMLGGRYIGRPDITKLGAELTRTCRAIYDATLTKIGPETIRFVGIGSRNYTFTPTAKQLSAVRKKGYWVTNGQYLLRPGMTLDSAINIGAKLGFQKPWKATSTGSGLQEMRCIRIGLGRLTSKSVQKRMTGSEADNPKCNCYCNQVTIRVRRSLRRQHTCWQGESLGSAGELLGRWVAVIFLFSCHVINLYLLQIIVHCTSDILNLRSIGCIDFLG
jgi:hypothetical protein